MMVAPATHNTHSTRPAIRPSPAKPKETLFDLCNQAKLQGNNISVRMLEFLTTTKHLPTGFRELAHEFLDLCRLVWSIESGLHDMTGRDNNMPPPGTATSPGTSSDTEQRQFPAEVETELDSKLRTLTADFTDLGHVLFGYLEYRQNGALGGFRKRWRLMFADKEIARMRENLSRNRDSLRMSALLFRWSLGVTKSEGSVGMGYAGLAAALERLRRGKPVAGTSALSVLESVEAEDAEMNGTKSGAIDNTMSPTSGKRSEKALDNNSNNKLDVANPPPTGPLPPIPIMKEDSSLRQAMTGLSKRASSPDLALTIGSDGHFHGGFGKPLPDLGSRRSSRSEKISAVQAGTLSRMMQSSPHAAGSIHNHPRGHAESLQESMANVSIGHGRRHSITYDNDSRTGISPEPGLNRDGIGSLHSHSIHTAEGSHADAAYYHNNSNNSNAHSHPHGSLHRHGHGPAHAGLHSVHSNHSANTGHTRNTANTINTGNVSGGQYGHIGHMAHMAHIQKQQVLALVDDPDMISDVISDEDLVFDRTDTESITTAPTPVIRLKADLSTVPRWTPRNVQPGNAMMLRSQLINAVAGQKPKEVQACLDRGASPETMPEACVLTEAVLNRDIETVRMLLLFGAKPNVVDSELVTPLLTAVDEDFMEAGKLLLKYAADPNLRAGPNSESPLALAVSRCNIEFVQLLLIYGGDPDLTVDGGDTSLIRAMTQAAPLRLAELMLDYGANPNVKSGSGKTALHDAIQARRVDLMRLIIDRGGDPNLPAPKHLLWPSTYHAPCLRLMLSRGADHDKCPGIMELAAGLNNITSIQLLLNAGVDPNVKKDGTYTPLCTAIRDDRADIFDLLLENGADPNLKASEYPAFKAVRLCRIHMIAPLVANGADLSSPPGLVEHAVRTDKMEVLNLILANGVNPNAKTEEGHTALTTAIRDGRYEMVKRLLSAGADPSIQGRDWPLYLAVHRPPILALLLAAAPDLPRSFRGVMEAAVSADRLDSVRMLVAAGVSVEDKNGGVFSPLTTAIREERKDIVRYLLRPREDDGGSADPNEPGEHLPLVKALRRCRGDDTEIIEMLLAKGADVNKMYRGWNAVMQALENCDANVLRLLLAGGQRVNMDAKDDAGRGLIEIARGRGWEEGVRMLTASSR